MNEGRWVTISGRRVFIRTNQHPMDAFIKQKKTKKLTRKDLIVGEIYKGADGYWNVDLKEGYENVGLPYIWAKTKRELYDVLDSLVRAENKWNRNKEE